MEYLRLACVACVIAAVGCQTPDAVLLSVSGDQPAQQYDLYVRDDATQVIVFHSGFNPVQLPNEPPRDITQDKLKIALKLSKGGKYTLLLVGVIGDVDGDRPAAGATQMFWAGRIEVGGTMNVDARLLTVPDGDDADGDLWPDASDFPAHVAEAAMVYAAHPDLLDCDDKIDNPTRSDGTAVSLKAAAINPFAVEICNDGFDENCDGNGDEACVDADHDHDFAGSDCDDNDPKRHHPTDIDPYPDPPNCCGYNLGMAGTPEEFVDYTGDPILCPMKRCGDGIDESCRGGATNDPANDTVCVIDADCDGDPAPPQGNDCDDHNPNVSSKAPEICGNGIDDNCNGLIDDGCVPCDLDGDGFQRNDPPNGCPDANDKHPGMLDCNDYDSGVYPGMTMDGKFNAGGKEGGVGTTGMLAASLRGTCRRVYEDIGVTGTAKIASFAQAVGDADCNGTAFEGCPPPSCDADGDGWPNANAGCNPNNVALDCNDADPTMYPGAPDKCGNGKAENCVADQACNGQDKDGDGYVAQYDCDDTNANIHPWAKELCNGVDDDCDNLVDEGNPDPAGVPLTAGGTTIACTDSDVGECAKTKGVCVCSSAQENVRTDPNGQRTYCPGENPPGASKPPHCFGAGQPKPQSCDATNPKDDDCNGSVDDPQGEYLLMKGMPCGITVGQCKAGIIVGCDMTKHNCFTQFGRTPASTDWYVCSSDTVCPQAELCNGLDDDCNGALPVNEQDVDKDGYLACSPCDTQLASGLLGCGDCNDSAPTVHPGAVELCNNVDDDCNAATADGYNDPACVGKTCCSSQSACRDLTSDVNNCTTCGNVCDPLTANACGPGGCLCGGAPACGSGAWCKTGSCTACNTNGHCGPGCVNCGAGAVCKSDGSACTGCNTDADCDGLHYCSGGACVARKNQGGTCGADDQCVGGGSSLFCTDGRCCTSSAASCNGCHFCNAAGSCVNVAAGSDPHNTCTQNVATCVSDFCDGAGGCTLANGTTCASPTCSGGSQTVNQCQGGSCQAMVSGCGTYACGATACQTSCTVDTQCASGNFCANPTCQAKKANGKACTGANQCMSGFCVDNVCCQVSGCGTCQACGGANGTCQTITSADDPNSCTGTETCDATGACKLKNGQGCGGGTACASTFCVGGTCCGTACNGGVASCSGSSVVPNTCATGSCNSTPKACSGGFNCTLGTCANSCQCAVAPCIDAGNCASGFFCDGAACQTQLGTGGACTVDAQCKSGTCNNGMGKCQ
jgi:hypothetical protein